MRFPANPPTTRRLWTLTKLWASLRDVPEVAALIGLASFGLTMGGYTYWREMWTPAGEAFPSVLARRDPDLQCAMVEAYHKPSVFERIAKWDTDDKGLRCGVFDNRFRPFEYNLPTHVAWHTSSRSEDKEPAATM
ncbi:hypothetical protein HYH03_013049 [Edaphochlamys debaryana]|uniref:Uncharacterized protein n=1 Tax=Edaphochlamys debaryana TaxID=47281 RepID=A0A835XZ94_9CHLO|nr:hypothetical protein HYH03_013049 [Edaphochlamys debaryana]|eukprot:KAG2488359.1 hypothetical protein HYH03_013049 [Edaphochlamys debaryana]